MGEGGTVDVVVVLLLSSSCRDTRREQNRCGENLPIAKYVSVGIFGSCLLIVRPPVR